MHIEEIKPCVELLLYATARRGKVRDAGRSLFSYPEVVGVSCDYGKGIIKARVAVSDTKELKALVTKLHKNPYIARIGL